MHRMWSLILLTIQGRHLFVIFMRRNLLYRVLKQIPLSESTFFYRHNERKDLRFGN